jgi:hypothetical protein
MIQLEKRSGHPFLLWTAEFSGGNSCGLTRKGLYRVETNGGSHRHPPAPGWGELKNRL